MRSRFSCVLGALCLAACDCGGEGLVQSTGRLEVAEVLDFGAVPVGGARSLPLVLTNAGTFRLRVCAAAECGEVSRVEPAGAPFSADFLDQTVRGAFELEPSESRPLPVELAPVVEGEVTAELVLVHDGAGAEARVLLRGTGARVPNPALVVEPAAIHFTATAPGEQASSSFTVRSSGADPVTIDRIESDAREIELRPAAALPRMLAPGETLDVEVVFTASGVVALDDRARVFAVELAGAVEVVLTSEAPAPAIAIAPSPLDFGTAAAGCASAQRPLTVQNVGTVPVTIHGASLAPPGDFAILAAPLPAALMPGATVALSIGWTPRLAGAVTSELRIEHSAAPAPAVVSVLGEGTTRGWVTEMFDQNPIAEVDVLFVVDDSGSMEDEQQALGANVTQFLAAAGPAVDYHIAVTSTDVLIPFPTGLYQGGKMGRFVEVGGVRIVGPATPNPAAALASLVTALGPNGGGAEQGLQAMRLALEEPLASGWNAGFRRPNAGLSVIVVSDEEDGSPGSVATFQAFLAGLGGAGVAFSAVIVPPGTNASCSDNGATVGQRYADLAAATGGTVESICTQSWGTALANVGLASFGLTSVFALGATPEGTSIGVAVDGVPMSGGWSYDAARNSVVFAPDHVPAPGARVEVSYQPAC